MSPKCSPDPDICRLPHWGGEKKAWSPLQNGLTPRMAWGNWCPLLSFSPTAPDWEARMSLLVSKWLGHSQHHSSWKLGTENWVVELRLVFI